MSELYWLTDEQMARLEPFFPKSHGKPRVDDRRVLSGIIFVNRNGLRWRDALAAYGPHKSLYNRWKRWSPAAVSPLTETSSRWGDVCDCAPSWDVQLRDSYAPHAQLRDHEPLTEAPSLGKMPAGHVGDG
jgi:Putative transposase of IS4/5 family (DUF4096)